MAKRKSGDYFARNTSGHSKKQKSNGTEEEHVVSREQWEAQFATGLFLPQNVAELERAYSSSKPYKHGVVEGLINDDLLRKVRQEVTSAVHYTEKETDIYKINQSGDLANLDGLDAASASRLPNLMKLRDAMYSPVFREYLESVTQCGKLSGSKTDMAINIYTPGSHLICHDDVIGSRRISYILYLTDPDDPWQEEWGGALRLFPTKERRGTNGKITYVPSPDASLSIYPQWNQLSFFKVEPGMSFHDVGEVYENPERPRDNQPLRAAISGWFHIPQSGEPGFVEGEAEALQKESSLTTLQSSDEAFDVPRLHQTPYTEYDSRYLRPRNKASRTTHSKIEEEIDGFSTWDDRVTYAKLIQSGEEDPDIDVLTAEEAEYLKDILNPRYLIPETVEEMGQQFHDSGWLVVSEFLTPKFAKYLHHAVYNHYARDVSDSARRIEDEGIWTVAKPPHKERYLVMNEKPSSISPAIKSLRSFFKSGPFRKWLQLVTECILKSHDTRLRRFRRGQDYQLAKPYAGNEERVEITFNMTPGGMWGIARPDEDPNFDHTRVANSQNTTQTISTSARAVQCVDFEPLSTQPVNSLTNHGGYEIFMAVDDDEDDVTTTKNDEDHENGTGSDVKREQPRVGKRTHVDVTGRQQRRSYDPAVYQSAGNDDEDAILLNEAVGFNRLNIVLRDKGTARFVKYVSQRTGCDRWDLAGEFEVDWKRTAKVHRWEEDDEDDNEGEGDEEHMNVLEDGDEDEDGTEDDDNDDDEE